MIIGLGHKREVGKDLAGKLIQTELRIRGKEAECVPFALPIYEICYKLYGHLGFKTKQFYDEHKEKKHTVLPVINMTPRDILIKMGTPAIREQVWDNTWLEYALNQDYDISIITDLRFPNEFKAIKDLGGICIRIDRDYKGASDDPSDPDNQLPENTPWDFVVDNNGTKRNLNDALMCVVNSL